MYLRKAHIYIIGMVLIGFHFAGTSVSVFPESRFPFHRIHGFREPEYSNTPSLPMISFQNVFTPTPAQLCARIVQDGIRTISATTCTGTLLKLPFHMDWS